MTPASLRAGGATWLYVETDAPDKVRFRGRWMSARMLEIYIQEVAADSFYNTLPQEDREMIELFASGFPTVMAFNST